MERLEQDLRFFRNELANERDQFRRNLILAQMRDIEQQILNLLRAERALLEHQNRNLQDMLEAGMKMKKK
jgi:hypothetical protein